MRGLAIVVLVVIAGTFAASGASASPATRYIDVSVATVWTSPRSPRAMDRPALGNPVNLQAWSGVMSTAARRGLVGRVQTQALFGEPVRVLARQGAWARIVVVDQPTPKDRRGYPGWVPSRQLVAGSGFGVLRAGPIAVVTRRTATLRGGVSLALSFGTRLPVVGRSSTDVLVVTPDGTRARLARAAVRLYRSAAAIPTPTGQAIVRSARMFLGVRYLWGGTSAFGFDCSGLISLVYRSFGVVIPRDADAQSRAGRPVAFARLRPGDVVFYGRGHVHHAALYAGGATMIEAPNSASSVRSTPLRASDFAGARRY